MKYSLHALIFAIVGGALGQLLLKAGMQGIQVGTPHQLYNNLISAPQSATLLLCGVVFYSVAVPAWIMALKRFDLSFAYPLLSLGYLIVYIGAFYWPGVEESITWQKTIGLSLIVVGVAIAAHSTEPDEQAAHDQSSKA